MIQASPEQQSLCHRIQPNCKLIFFSFIIENRDPTGTIPNRSKSKFKPSPPWQLVEEVVEDPEEAVEYVAEAVATKANQEHL